MSLATILCLTSAVQGLSGTIDIDATKPGAKVPSSLYGIFLEEINNAGEGGLYAEMVQNRGFEDANVPPACLVENGQLVPPRTPHYWENKPNQWTMAWPYTSPFPSWRLETKGGAKASIRLDDSHPLSQESKNALRMDVSALPKGARASLVNEGFWGMNVQKGERYNLSFYVRSNSQYNGPIEATLTGRDGKALATHTFANLGKAGWQKVNASLLATGTDAKATLSLSLGAKGNVAFDFVSLFPAKTFKNRPNGLRPDLGKMIEDLKPAFIRYPGGCYVEGVTIETRPHWEETLGPLEKRTPTFSPWGYWNSNGFGYHEWLQFCEDVHADGLYVFSAGISCAFRSGTYLPDDQLPGLIQNTMDAIEYAVGPTTSKWGKLRAQNGHPKPFPLKYVEIGNEDQGPKYGERVAKFYKVIKAKYPKIKIILSSWIAGIDHAAINAAGQIDIVDEHAYKGAGWALNHFDSFASYPRDVSWELYIGEFAANGGVGRGNMLATLNDAAYMMNMEKNADIVKMGSYAPLLENTNRREWDVNLIHFDSSRSYGRASYYACKLFADNRPDVNLTTKVEVADGGPAPIKGALGVGTFASEVEFKDISLTQNGQTVSLDNAPGWKPKSGRWSRADGVYRQSSRDANEIWSFLAGDFGDKTINLKARKVAGDEGFLVSLGEIDGLRIQVNFGGWGNSIHAIQINSAEAVASTRGKIETGRWYDVRVETENRTVRAYLDGKLVVQMTVPKAKPVIAISGVDNKTGDVIVKVVNSSPVAADMTLNLKGVRVGTTGTATVLTSDNVTDENTYAQPTKIVPVTTPLRLSAPQLTHRFAPNSLTILRIQTRSQARNLSGGAK